MSSRNYNKLYVHKDREEGSEKILLGYQDSLREIILYKDAETVFHVPYYTNPILLSETTLIQDGATGGPFPAAADRIFKNRKDYGNITANGPTTDVADGVWFCSWLHKDEFGNLQWMDRYYNPGSLILSIAIKQLQENYVYKKNDPVFRDVPTTMTFEAGVQYRYFHIGESTAKQLITTFSGISGERLHLNLNGWGTDTIDTSINNNDAKVVSNGTTEELYSVPDESDRVAAPSINFNNKNKIDAYVEYDSSYNFSNEFTLAFWAHSNNWFDSQTTQLVGNYTSTGGVGVFIDTLSSYPYFVIPETGYGHMLYINEQFSPFLDKSLQLTVSLTASPQLICLDSDNNLFVCNVDSSHKINKFDHTGKLLATTALLGVNITQPGGKCLQKYCLDWSWSTMETQPSATSVTWEAAQCGNSFEKQWTFEECAGQTQTTEVPLQILCGMDDTVIVITDRARYTYDTNLNLINTTPWISLSSSVAAFACHVDAGTAELISIDNVYDSKFIYADHWCLSATNGNLYVRYEGDTTYTLAASFADIGTQFAVDPFDRIWVLHGNNNLSIYDTNTDVLGNSIPVGEDVLRVQKNISFICTYNRNTNSREWKCLIYYADYPDSLTTPQMYVLDMNGNLIQTINILSLFDQKLLNLLGQQQKSFQFLGKGDFTGYERRRIFNQLPPYNNEPQIIVRASLKDKLKTELPYTEFKSYSSIADWDLRSWQHIALTLQNRVFNLFVNGLKIADLPYSGQYELSYELQPTLFIGSPTGSQIGINNEIGYTSLIFNGIIQDVKMYDYVLDARKLELFQRASIPAQNMYWSLPTPSIQYIEKIERMFKNKIPGAKATFFNLKLHGMNITDAQTRAIIEQELRVIVSKIKPAYTNFLNVHWID